MKDESERTLKHSCGRVRRGAAIANQSPRNKKPRPETIIPGRGRVFHGSMDRRPPDSLGYLLSMVTPGQSSVRKGVSGRPAALYMLQTGLSAQA